MLYRKLVVLVVCVVSAGCSKTVNVTSMETPAIEAPTTKWDGHRPSDADFFTGADLTDAELEYANLTGTNLWDANLTDANLENTVLENAYLAGANLTKANLTGANLRNAHLASTTMPDGWEEMVAIYSIQ